MGFDFIKNECLKVDKLEIDDESRFILYLFAIVENFRRDLGVEYDYEVLRGKFIEYTMKNKSNLDNALLNGFFVK